MRKESSIKGVLLPREVTVTFKAIVGAVKYLYRNYALHWNNLIFFGGEQNQGCGVFFSRRE